ncbi:MAG: dihydroorotase [Butyrivibrio sp.]|nr:dihydroorotase [Butyrivibrio sp.]
MIIIKGGHVIDPESGLNEKKDLVIEGWQITEICEPESPKINDCLSDPECEVIDASGMIVAPGLVDCHVHFRDPGFTYKEDIETGSKAALRGGFTTVVMMGNTEPHFDNYDTVRNAVLKGARCAPIRVFACGNVTKGMEGKELVDMDELLKAGAVLFTDDGKPITDEGLMEQACIEASKRNKIISLHEEDPAFITENGINAGEVAKKLGITGSPRQAEVSMVERDIDIAERTGASIVIQHISAEQSVKLIRDAKKRGVKVYAEATPHHFTLTESAVLKYGTLAKMNPPLRLESDRMAIIEGLRDGTIEMIATDHAPHASYEKEKELTSAPSGITGLETSLALGIKELVNPGFLTMEQLLERMTIGPARVCGLDAGYLHSDGYANIVIFSPDEEWTYEESASKSSNSPFFGWKLPGRIHFVISMGVIAYRVQTSGK